MPRRIESTRKVVRAKAYFLLPEEGGRSRNVNLWNSRHPYELLADFGFGYTDDGVPIYCPAEVGLDSPGYIELGVEQTVLVGLWCPEHVVNSGLHRC